MFDDKMGCLSDTTTQHERSSVCPVRNCSSMLRNTYKVVIALNSQEGKKEIFKREFQKKWCRQESVRATEVYFAFAVVLTPTFHPFKYELLLPISVSLIFFDFL